jgi:peptidoglycan/xylan/chitin deacetylase (PgdA/CDA1 family)
MLHLIRKCKGKYKGFIQGIALKEEIAHLQDEDRILYGGNVHLPEIALTFDDGPDPSYTLQILDILQQYGVKATFFCLGHRVAAYPHIVKQVYEAGHVIGNHTWAHPDLALLSASDIVSQLKCTSDVIQKVIGKRPMFFRPPYGTLTRQVLEQAYDLGFVIIMWCLDTQDWESSNFDLIIRRVLDQVRDGAIIIMHDGALNCSQPMAALPIFIEKLQARGIQFVTIQQVFDNLHKSPLPSQTYKEMKMGSLS